MVLSQLLPVPRKAEKLLARWQPRLRPDTSGPRPESTAVPRCRPDPATLRSLQEKLEQSENYEFTIFMAKLISQMGGKEAVSILGKSARAAENSRSRVAIIDVLVDLRKGSPTYGEHQVYELNEKRRSVLYIPKGIAHGFYALTDQAMVSYSVSEVFSAECDAGVHWNSCGIDWPCENPILSQKDETLPRLEDFESPFE